jgi:hypothetical protein
MRVGDTLWMAMRPDRPKFKTSSNLRLDTPAAEFGEAARAFGANFGTWSVNEADKTLTSRYEAALIPNNEGIEFKESISLAGDELKLISNAASGAQAEDIYRRAKWGCGLRATDALGALAKPMPRNGGRSSRRPTSRGNSPHAWPLWSCSVLRFLWRVVSNTEALPQGQSLNWLHERTVRVTSRLVKQGEVRSGSH